MPNGKRPRVAAIGLDSRQLAVVASLSGEMRKSDTLGHYLTDYSWTETDLLVASPTWRDQVDVSVNLLTIGPMSLTWSDASGYRPGGVPEWHTANVSTDNTERELHVPDSCPDRYKPLAAELSRQLIRSAAPPSVVTTSRRQAASLIETTSGLPVALRLVLPNKPKDSGQELPGPIALILPEEANLAAWLPAMLSDIHESDPNRVPNAPPRLGQPSDWYTPEERGLADSIAKADTEMDHLQARRAELEVELSAAGQRADEGVRRILWLDGDELVAAAGEILSALGFTVRDMDAELEPREQKREDLRLTLSEEAGWEAIVEVKGYTNSTKTSDSRQVREQRERYIKEETRAPDLTLWLCNPYRETDPSSRPPPDQNVQEAAENVGAVHALTTDLYRQWALVAAGNLDAEAVVQSLKGAEPGLWTPPDADAGG